MKASSELAQARRAWSASVRDVVNSIGDADSVQVSKRVIPFGLPERLKISLSKVSQALHLLTFLNIILIQKKRSKRTAVDGGAA